jgi:hypothetical protein
MKYSLSFIGNEAAPGHTDGLALIGDFTQPGDRLLWSIPSYSKTTQSGTIATTGTKLDEVEKDGGSWVGHVTVLPRGILNTVGTYYPNGNSKRDSVQLCGPIDKAELLSAESNPQGIDAGKTCFIPIVGGTGKYAGARGESQVRIVSSDKGTLLFIYDIDIVVD